MTHWSHLWQMCWVGEWCDMQCFEFYREKLEPISPMPTDSSDKLSISVPGCWRQNRCCKRVVLNVGPLPLAVASDPLSSSLYLLSSFLLFFLRKRGKESIHTHIYIVVMFVYGSLFMYVCNVTPSIASIQKQDFGESFFPIFPFPFPPLKKSNPYLVSLPLLFPLSLCLCFMIISYWVLVFQRLDA